MDAASRQQCADANGVNWANTVFSVIATEHPGAAATVGMFTYQAVNKDGPNGLPPVPSTSDPRYPLRCVGSVCPAATRCDFLTAALDNKCIYVRVDMGGGGWVGVSVPRVGLAPL